ncbi:aquaporin-4 isoform 2 [Planoprotostelium fungivorum]|uniref:Aquaporin-4 isoform 2 n=1 Tax=Planoprotostelium fungivorum TaxID=1890364 RepID=A0A2P6MNU5_9EUKA|nr:aquaporin-4 isoform 2 [Planoprotostelium fungivorum]
MDNPPHRVTVRSMFPPRSFSAFGLLRFHLFLLATRADRVYNTHTNARTSITNENMVGRKVGKDTVKNKGNVFQRWGTSWKEWHLNHHPKNAFTKVAFRQYLAECLGTALFVYVSTGSVVALGAEGGLPSPAFNVAIALTFGFAIAAMVYATALVSGGHLNPAVTLTLVLTSNKNAFKGIFYIIAQIIGGILGSAFLRASAPEAQWKNALLGATTLQNGTTPGQGVFIEAILTFILVFTVFGTVKLDMTPHTMGQLAALAIGLAVLVCHMMGASLTGPSINPARSFGPAVVGGHWENQWVYWVGPLIGGVLAGLVYQFLLSPDLHEPTPGNEERKEREIGKEEERETLAKDLLRKMEEGEISSDPHQAD